MFRPKKYKFGQIKILLDLTGNVYVFANNECYRNPENKSKKLLKWFIKHGYLTILHEEPFAEFLNKVPGDINNAQYIKGKILGDIEYVS